MKLNFGKLKSRKLWVTIALGAITTLSNEVGIDPGIIKYLIALGGSYLVGQGLADFGKEKAAIERDF